MTDHDPAPEFLDFLGSQQQGVLTTIRSNGRPQLSNVRYVFDPAEATVRVSVTADRAKTRNLEHDPRVGLHVTSSDFWTWVVVEGTAELTATATDPDDDAVDALVELYRSMAGEHPDWADYRRAMVADRRRVVSFRVEHAYGQLPGE